MSIPTVALSALPDPLPERLVVLDVREQGEWDAGHVEGAVHVPLMDLPDRFSELSTEQTLVVCRVGGRSAQATLWLSRQGLEVVNLDGGMLEWEAAGRAMVSENGRPPQVL